MNFNELSDDWGARAAVLEGLLAAVGRGSRGRPQLAARRRLAEGLAAWWRMARRREPDGKTLDLVAFTGPIFANPIDANPASVGKIIY